MVILSAFMLVGVGLLIAGNAATIATSYEPENGAKSASILTISGSGTSGSKSIKFLLGTNPNTNYQSNLNMLMASPYRNKLEDNSPYLNTTSANLPLDILAPMTQAARDVYAANGEQPFLDTSQPIGAFRIWCEFSHFSYDDPIVKPNNPGAAHLHMYWGNTHANAYTNYNTLMNSGGGTCNGNELNRTAYWAPAIIDGTGKVRVPRGIMMYYKSFNVAYGKVEVYPENLKFVSDNNINKTLYDGKDFGDAIATFGCDNDYNGNKSNYGDTMPTCAGTVSEDGFANNLEMNIKFNQCWNGVIDPVNDTKNMSYTNGNWYGGNCPSNFSHTFSNLEYRIFYRVEPGEDTSSWFLSSDVDMMTGAVARGTTAHADWFGGWNKAVNKLWVDNCNNPSVQTDCASGFLGGLPSQGNQFRTLKMRNQYWKANHLSKVDGTLLFKAVCPSVNKTITKPSDLAFCKPM